LVSWKQAADVPFDSLGYTWTAEEGGSMEGDFERDLALRWFV
jgi:hypothetical protein